MVVQLSIAISAEKGLDELLSSWRPEREARLIGRKLAGMVAMAAARRYRIGYMGLLRSGILASARCPCPWPLTLARLSKISFGPW